MSELEKRLHAYRPDIADASLQGRVLAQRFVAGVPMEIIVPVASVQREPSASAAQTTQALFGEKLMVFEDRDGWIWGQLQRDGYVGYIARALVAEDVSRPTHRVAVPSTFIYPQPHIKSQPALSLPMNALLEITGDDAKFSQLSNGKYILTRHIRPKAEFETDFVGVAEKFMDVPYYWGGKSAGGLDCSGLVQTALEACGVFALRDADLQEKQLGQNLMINDLDGLRRGDLVFWKGHVGIMADDRTLLHATGHYMLTVKESLGEAIRRIAASEGQVTSIKRL